MTSGWPEPPVPVQRVFASHPAQLAILSLGTTEIRQRGVLFTEGERARALFILLRGEVELSAASQQFHSDAIAGDCIGLLSVIKGTYAMCGKNTSTVVLRVISRSDFLHAVAVHDEMRSSIQSYAEEFRQRVGEAIELPPVIPTHSVRGR